MTVVKIKTYRGAHILILNEFQGFIWVAFYKGKFYAGQLHIEKQGEYTLDETESALKATLCAAKLSIDQICERSFPLKQIKQCQKFLQISKDTSPTTK